MYFATAVLALAWRSSNTSRTVASGSCASTAVIARLLALLMLWPRALTNSRMSLSLVKPATAPSVTALNLGVDAAPSRRRTSLRGGAGSSRSTAKAAHVDLAIEAPQAVLLLRQPRQPAKYLALDRDVVLAVGDQARELFGRDLRPIQLRWVFALGAACAGDTAPA